MKDFRDKTAVVTGAASGIGRAMAERFAAEGMRVVLADVEQTALDAAEREMTAAGAAVIAIRTDVSKPEQVEALATRAVERFGGVQVLCNNAGVVAYGSIWELTLQDWEWVVGVDLWGVIHGIRTFVPIMLKQGDEGHIVNTASIAGLLANSGSAPYDVSKFGVVALSETLHHELAMAPTGKIGISVLCPGLVNTRILESERNHPAGAPAEALAGTPQAAMRDVMRQIIQAGIPPCDVAERVFESVRDRRFYVLPHPEFKAGVAARAEAIVSGGPPPARALG